MNITDLPGQLPSAAFVYAIAAGDDVNFLWGNDREALLDRMAIIRVGLIAANLDVDIFAIDPAKLRDRYTALVREIGPEHIHFLPDPGLNQA